MLYSLTGKRVFVAGHRGMVGSAIVRQLEGEGCQIIYADRSVDLTNQAATSYWMKGARPDVVIVAAAKVGGILANSTFPAAFLYDNLMIAANCVNAAHGADVDRLLFLGSSCIYPKFAEQPIVEDALLQGALEPTNEWYAVAKIAGIKLCQAYRQQYNRKYISAMPTNLYGPNDNYDLTTSHVLPALIRKVDHAKRNKIDEVVIWGTGTPRREFLHADDCANACVYLLKHYDDAMHINVGSGEDLTINELVAVVGDVIGYTGRITHDLSKPDGTPRKLMSSNRLTSLGWKPTIELRDGIESAYKWFLEHHT